MIVAGYRDKHCVGVPNIDEGREDERSDELGGPYVRPTAETEPVPDALAAPPAAPMPDIPAAPPAASGGDGGFGGNTAPPGVAEVFVDWNK